MTEKSNQEHDGAGASETVKKSASMTTSNQSQAKTACTSNGQTLSGKSNMKEEIDATGTMVSRWIKVI